MKKLILFLIFFIGSIQITFTPNNAISQSPMATVPANDFRTIRTLSKNVGGMEYRVFTLGNNSIFVINETKEKLEIEKLKLEIQTLKRGLR